MPYDLQALPTEPTSQSILPAIVPNTLPETTSDKALKDQLIHLLATSYVRREGRYFHIDRPSMALAKDDLQRSFITATQHLTREHPNPKALLKEVFNTAITEMNADPDRSIPVWTGATEPSPGNPERRIQLASGQFVLNSWTEPTYRQVAPTEEGLGSFRLFFEWLFPRQQERDRVLDWLAWCLQNEGKKPNWAVMLYSKAKGTGKSTFCRIATRLFGSENTSIENSIEKVAGKFNGPVLSKKLVICEEVNLRPDSDVGNKLKTLITEPFTTAENKGRDVAKVQLFSVFLLNSNHLPLWIEAGERRFYVVDVDHDGHASGPRAEAFSKLVKTIDTALESDERVAGLYDWLMTRKLAADFDPMSLNTAVHSTEVMKRILANQTAATTQQLAEFLGREGAVVITEQDLRIYVTGDLKLKPNAIRHMMSELGWTRREVKWGGKDYTRALWTAPDYAIDRGNIIGPDGSKKAICDVLWADQD